MTDPDIDAAMAQVEQQAWELGAHNIALHNAGAVHGEHGLPGESGEFAYCDGSPAAASDRHRLGPRRLSEITLEDAAVMLRQAVKLADAQDDGQ